MQKCKKQTNVQIEYSDIYQPDQEKYKRLLCITVTIAEK